MTFPKCLAIPSLLEFLLGVSGATSRVTFLYQDLVICFPWECFDDRHLSTLLPAFITGANTHKPNSVLNYATLSAMMGIIYASLNHCMRICLSAPCNSNFGHENELYRSQYYYYLERNYVETQLCLPAWSFSGSHIIRGGLHII